MPKTMFFIRHCPMNVSCSSQSFKRAQVWGPTEQEARDRLLRHLTVSGSHTDIDYDDARTFVQLAEVETYTERERPAELAIGAKRQKLAPGPKQPTTPPSLVLAAAGAAAASSSDGYSGRISMRETELTAVMDCVSRAQNAAQQAHLLAMGAANAFADEAAVLAEALANLRSIHAEAPVDAPVV